METGFELDQKVFYLINHVLTPSWADFFFVSLTDFAKTPFFYFVLPVILFFIFRQFGIKGFAVLFLALLLSSLADIFSSSVLKEIFASPRPEFSSLPFELILRRPSEGSFSFPSSHALDGFTFAGAIFYFSRPWGGGALLLAGLVAYSRVYVGLHFPLDVFAGALLGVIFGLAGAGACVWIYKRAQGVLR